MTDILSLIQADGHSFKRIASTGKGEFCGACPFCGGNDRFRIWPNNKGGRFWCRGCGRTGDSVQYIRETRGLDYKQALQYLGIEGDYKDTARKKKIKSTFQPEEKETPPALWQEKAEKFLLWTQAQLLTPGGAAALNILTGKGLTRETIRAAGIGANTGERGGDIYRNFSSWGLPPECRENGKLRKLWIPTGIIIPLIDDGVKRLRVRRDDPQDGQRYIVVHGSTSKPLILGKERNSFLIVESELDGWLCWQEAGALAGIIALGSASAKPDKETYEILLNAEKILIALDYDAAGAKAAYSFWPQTYREKVIRWPTPEGKDASEAYQKGINIRAWVEAGLE
jgi:DNA primase